MKDRKPFLRTKLLAMPNTKFHFHLSEKARNATIVALILIVVVVISYFEWKGRG